MTYSSCDPSKYLEQSISLNIPNDPEKVRSSVDRAYYAAFLFARDQLAAKGYITPFFTTDDHKYVPTNLKLVCGSIGNDESRLRILRNRLTYDTRAIIGCPTVEWVIHTSSAIIERVKSLPRKNQITPK